MAKLNFQVGDKISDTINPNPALPTGFQIISAVSSAVVNGVNVYTLTVPLGGPIVVNEFYANVSQVVGQSTGPTHWVVGK